ncbi:MAG: hypothetical protein V7609_3531 [Verrucomicrobiota bacterium]
MYQPDLGRFLQADPIGFDAGDMNLFRYYGDDPVDRSDPTGLLDTATAIWNMAKFFDSSSTSQSSLYEMNKFQEIQGIINRLITEIADAKKIEERSGSKVSWEFTGNWSEPYGNHVTGEKLTANDKPAAGRTDPGFDVRDKDGGVGTQLKIDWKIRRSVASDPQVALMEVRDHVAGLVRWGIAMQKHTTSDGTFWPTVKSLVTNDRSGTWLTIAEAPPAAGKHCTLKVEIEATTDNLSINLKGFEPFIAKYKFGKVTLTTGDSVIFSLSDLLPPKD